MKKIISIFLVVGALLVSCTDKKPADIPDWRDFIEDTDKDEPGVSKDKVPSDMVLIYGGSGHRQPLKWSGSYLKDYVIYTDRSGKKHWLFDGFLCLEFMYVNVPTGNKTFITDYSYEGVKLPSATKVEWQALIDYYFEVDGGLNAIEKAVDLASEEMGESPKTKRKVVIGIPEPITNERYSDSKSSTVYWGKVAGKELDFSNSADRLTACQWYVDEITERFKDKKYKNIELVGFYWVAEKAKHTRDLMSKLGAYLKGKDLTFNWIPYFNADGYSEWKSFGFDVAYLQPNYFFNDAIPESRLDEACDLAKRHKMGMEIEFDGNALESNGRGYKLENYMKAFKKYGIWESCPLAYYQGSWALKWLKGSGSQYNQNLYHDFCEFVITRPYRNENNE